MRYLRMFTNALAGARSLRLYLAVLVLQLNPHVSGGERDDAGWLGALLAMYGPYVTALILLTILGGEALVSRPLPSGLAERCASGLAERGLRGPRDDADVG
jgi:hypothetical protein